MLSFQKSSLPTLPHGYFLERGKVPKSHALNRLFNRCRESTHSPEKLDLAIKKSDCSLSIYEQSTGLLVGFVRVTSDKGLNANLWNLVAEPGPLYSQLLAVLVYEVLVVLRREMPGCSVSISASKQNLNVLKDQGFLIDPGGIRAMGFRFRRGPFKRWNFPTLNR